jgi:hypothetical protein
MPEPVNAVELPVTDALKIQMFAEHVEVLTDDEIKQRLVELYRVYVQDQANYLPQLRQAWGLD